MSTGPGNKNAPSRWRFRPPGPPTFRLRFPPPGSDSSYRRSVLDAVATLRRCATGCKTSAEGKFRNLQKVQFSTFPHPLRRPVEVAHLARSGLTRGTIFELPSKPGGQGGTPRGEPP